MSRTLYDIYQKNVFVLARTCIIKHDAIAQSINRELINKNGAGYHIGSSRINWKYYINLSGQYHASDIAALEKEQGSGKGHMIITISSDNGPVETAFTAELLRANPALANEYSYDSYLYRDLISRYPDFRVLISSIINPVDINIAIGAKDGQVLYCGGYYYTGGGYIYSLPTFVRGQTLIEPQEISTIISLQNWIDKFFIRWFNPDYMITDALYLQVKLGAMFSAIPHVVMNIRKSNYLTPQAHSYHIREYLESHGKLAKYADALNTEQLLYLYRNLIWLESNQGKQFVFDAIVDNLLTPSQIPLAQYDLKHDITDIQESLQPAPIMHRSPVNFIQVGSGNNFRTIYNVLDDQAYLAPANGDNADVTGQRIVDSVKGSAFGQLPTKVLESKMIDYVDYSPFPFTDVVFNLWLFLAANDSFTGLVTVTHPVTGQKLLLTPKVAFVLSVYCYNVALSDIYLEDIPVVHARLIPRLKDWVPDDRLEVRPSIADIKKVTSQKRLTDGDYLNIQGNLDDTDYPDFKTAIEATWGANSPESFYDKCDVIHEELMRRYHVYVRKEDMHARAHLEYAASRYYWLDIPCNLNPDNVKYDQWLLQQGLDLRGLTQADYLRLADEIGVKIAPRPNSKGITLARLQEAMLGILGHFKSYTTHVIKSINNDAVVMIDGKVLRFTNIVESNNSGLVAQIDSNFHYDIKMTYNDRILLGNYVNKAFQFSDAVAKDHISLGKLPNLYKNTRAKYQYRLTLSSLDIYNYTGSVSNNGVIPPDDDPTTTTVTELTEYVSDSYPT